MKILIVLSTILFLGATAKDSFELEIKKLLHLKPEAYALEIAGLRKAFETYFNKREAICQGEYSSNILNETETPKIEKLSKEEKKLCMAKMQKMQREYINGIFLARKRYLEHLHKIRVQNLIEAKELQLKKLSVY